MSFIDPYQLATGGQNSRNTFTLASNGILVDVEIFDIPPIILPPTEVPAGSSGGSTDWMPSVKNRKISRKKIVVTATINGVQYKQEKIVENKPKLSIKDVGVNVIENKNGKPIIEINVK